MSTLNQGISPHARLAPPTATLRRPIVLVEDDEAIRETFCELLEEEGYRVLTANNGREALAVLDSLHGEPCLVLLDMMMPVMDGWEFLGALRTDQHDIPVVVISAVAEATAGAVRVVRKPVDIDTLLDAVHQYA